MVIHGFLALEDLECSEYTTSVLQIRRLNRKFCNKNNNAKTNNTFSILYHYEWIRIPPSFPFNVYYVISLCCLNA